MTLPGAFAGSIAYGRLAGRVGRKKLYRLEAAMMVAVALASTFAPNVLALIAFRFILRSGVGGDYPVSAVLMSEYSNRAQPGQARRDGARVAGVGMIAGCGAGLVLLSTGIDDTLVWRVLLGLGTVPAAEVLYTRRRMPESPRYLARVVGDTDRAAASLHSYSGGAVDPALAGQAVTPVRLSLRQLITTRRYRMLRIGVRDTLSPSCRNSAPSADNP